MVRSMIRTLSRPVLRAVLASAVCVAASGSWAQTSQPSRGSSEPAQPRGGSAPKAAKPNASPEAKPDAKAAAQQSPAGGAQKASAQKPAAKPGPAAGPMGGQAQTLGTFGDWGAFTSQQGGAKLCYVISQPKDRQPKTLTREAGYFFVSAIPSRNVKNEIAIIMGFPTKDAGAAEAAIGATTYALVTKEQNAWVKNPADEAQVVATLSKGSSLVIKAASKQGSQTTDRYSLNGFRPALERMRKECGGV